MDSSFAAVLTTSIRRAYYKIGEWRKDIQVVQEHKEQGFCPGMRTYRPAIILYKAIGQWTNASALLDEIILASLKPRQGLANGKSGFT